MIAVVVTLRGPGTKSDPEPLFSRRRHRTAPVHPALLPGRADEHRGDGLFRTGVGVGDDQLQPPCWVADRGARRKAVQNAACSLSPTAKPGTSRRPPGSGTHALDGLGRAVLQLMGGRLGAAAGHCPAAAPRRMSAKPPSLM